MMNSKECILTAMAGGKPDKIPIFFSCMWDYIVRAAEVSPSDWVFGGQDERLAIEMDCLKRHNGICLHKTSGFLNRPLEKKDKPFGFPEPGMPPWTKFIETNFPETVFFHEAPADIVEEKSDISRVILNDDNINSGNDTSYIKAIIYKIGKDYLLAPGGFGLFPHTRRCMGGLERTLIALLESGELIENIMDEILTFYMKQIDLLSCAGVEAIVNGAYNEGADIINPKMWKQMIFPRHKQFVKMCHDKGIKAVCWFLGDCMPLVEYIAEAGYDLLAIEEPRRGYSSDVGEMRRRAGRSLCITGWIPELAVITGDREAIARCVDEQIEAAGRDGAFAFTTPLLDSNVNPETVEFFCNKVLEYY